MINPARCPPIDGIGSYKYGIVVIVPEYKEDRCDLLLAACTTVRVVTDFLFLVGVRRQYATKITE